MWFQPLFVPIDRKFALNSARQGVLGCVAKGHGDGFVPVWGFYDVVSKAWIPAVAADNRLFAGFDSVDAGRSPDRRPAFIQRF